MSTLTTTCGCRFREGPARASAQRRPRAPRASASVGASAAHGTRSARRPAGALLAIFAAASAFFALTAGCGAGTTPHALDIAALRARAAAHPTDAAALADLAEGELLLDGGDATVALRAIDAALALDPTSVRLRFLRATERDLHGHFEEGFGEHIQVIDRARHSSDPWAPVMAEASISAIEDYDDTIARFPARVEEAFAPLAAEPGALGAAATHNLREVLLEMAMRRGDLDAARARAAEAGCIRSWRVAGPFGPDALLGFDEDLPPEAPGPLDQSYDLGPGRGVRATRDVEARGCPVAVGNGPVSAYGTTFAETSVEVPSAGRYVLRLETANAAEVFVDDVSIARLDRRRVSMARVTLHALELSAGTHRVLVEMATRHPNPVFMLSLAPARADEADVELSRDTPLGRLLAVLRGITRADWVGARETLGEAANGDDAPVPFLVLGTIIALADPVLGDVLGPDEARRLVARAVERDPGAWYPAFQNAVLEFRGGRTGEAIELLRAAADAFPEVLLFPLTLLDAYEEREWADRRPEVIARLRERFPTTCRPVRAALAAARARGRESESGELAEVLVGCDARSNARLEHLVRQRRWDDARSELGRLVSLEPASDRAAALDSELELARGDSDPARIDAILAELSALAPRSEPLTIMRADRRLAVSDRAGARDVVARALESEPGALHGLRSLLRSAFRESELEAYRLDGADVIRRFEASGHSYEGAPRVLVLDYTVTRLFSDGSTLELTHNIIRVQSDEAAESEAQFSPPEDSEILTLRTVNADGTRLEPDAIAGLEHVELPGVEPGDYVEFEYLRMTPPHPSYGGGAVGPRFYFQNFETPFDWSTLTLIAPADVEIAVDPRGPAPTTEVRDAAAVAGVPPGDGGLRIYQWQVHQSMPLVPEPGGISFREYFPSVMWGTGATWEQYVRTITDALADRSPADPSAARLAREIAAGDARSTPEARMRRVYDWVLENVEESGELFGSAPAMALSRSGNRSRVLAYLLTQLDIEAELAMVREFDDDATRGVLPDEDTYGTVLVRARGSEGWVWMSVGQTGAAFGTLPPLVRGMDAIVLNASAERTTVAATPDESDMRTVEVEVFVELDGSARFEVSETFRGAGAALWRDQLEAIPSAQLEDLFDQAYVSRLLPGAHTTSLVITGRQDTAMDLTVTYEFEVDEIGREVRDVRLVPALYPTLLTPAYARLADRAVTQVIGAPLVVEARVRVHVPAGANVGTLPDPLTLHGPHGAQASWSATLDGSVVTLARRVHVPRMRVLPEEYDALAEFCQDTDEAEAFELRLEM